MSISNIILAALADKVQIFATGAILLSSIQDHPIVSLGLAVGVFGFAVWNKYQNARKAKAEADLKEVERRKEAAEALKLELENRMLKMRVEEAEKQRLSKAE